MSSNSAMYSTGIPGLDNVLSGIMTGDNIVWQVGSMEEYSVLADAFSKKALAQKHKITYFRFAQHAPLFNEADGVNIVHLNPQVGFETFLDGIHEVIRNLGKGGCYIFDSLSDLVANWYCDQMVGNFFQLTCPYLYDMDTVAYFPLIRGVHSKFAMEPITSTTQILIEVYKYSGNLYIHPVKVENRDAPDMYRLHVLDGDEASPVNQSHTVSEIMKSSPRSALGISQHQLGFWTRSFIQAEALLMEERLGRASPETVREVFHNLLRMAISHDDRVLRLAERYLTLEDMVALGSRLLGTGLIGGKSVGMLLANAILAKTSPRWENLLEAHDSFYIPSDVFYTFLVRNNCWSIRKRQIMAVDYLEGAEEARKRILAGTFPAHMIKRFEDMLDYFGQSPIIVRSSSLLEDNFGNSFAGKYDSVFCANQGTHAQRLDQFIAAVKFVYASTMSAQALQYRARRGLLDKDEQMALLVQRVSGAKHGRFYFPQTGGVGFSFNPYAWNEKIDPEAGVLRLVFGLGTRAVDRTDDDYTRIVALNAPERRPESNPGDAQYYAQRKVDVIDLEKNTLSTQDFAEIIASAEDMHLNLYTRRDSQYARQVRYQGEQSRVPRSLSFDRLLTETSFAADMRKMLEVLEEAYEYPVDIEFTVNFIDEKRYKMNLVQCRPFQVQGGFVTMAPPREIREEQVLFRIEGPVIGHSRLEEVQRIIYVVPATYSQLPMQERYAVARLVGQLTHFDDKSQERVLMLLGPGRWGTTTPSLGVPVSFAEINTVSVLCEIVEMREDLVPDVSLGTHFFSELVEVNTLYLALFPTRPGNFLKKPVFEQGSNQLLELLPDAAPYENVIRVFDASDLSDKGSVKIYADTIKQHAVCYVE
jgi:pyruvate, water dikinase